MKLPYFLLGALCLSFSTASTVGEVTDEERQLRRKRVPILDIAKSAGFKTLVTALGIAGLDSEFGCTWRRNRARCPLYTVFAPTDEAFSALDKELVKKLTTDNSYIEHLRGLLKYHVVPGRVKANRKAIENNARIKTLLGDSVVATRMRGNIKINNANVLKRNVQASNGLVQVVDSVLVPPFLTNDVVDVAIANPSMFSTLVKAAQAAGLVDALKGGPLTVLAPTNEAFSKLGMTLSDLLKPENQATLADILKYHVLPGIVVDKELKDGPIKTLLGKEIDVDVQSDKVVLNDKVKITDVNILANNGIIHVIDTVLIPPEPKTDKKPDIVDVASSIDDFSILVKAVSTAGLVDTLRGGPFTVFAPTNEAFTRTLKQLGLTLDALLKEANRETLTNILLYHVVPGVVTRDDLRDGSVATALKKSSIEVDVKYFFGHFRYAKLNGDTKITSFDTKASNGIIHVIDKVLIPPEPLPDIVEVASSNKDFSTLVAAVKAAGLVETLQSEGPFTVFAPTNASFDRLLKKLDTTLDAVVADTETLKKILLYHVIPGKVRFRDLTEGSVDTALMGEALHVDIQYKRWYRRVGATINGIKVVDTDIEASNGIVHVIDDVLLPSNL